MKTGKVLSALVSIAVVLALALRAEANNCLAQMNRARCNSFGNYIKNRSTYNTAKRTALAACKRNGNCKKVKNAIKWTQSRAGYQCRASNRYYTSIARQSHFCSAQTVKKMHNYANTATVILHKGKVALERLF